MTFGVVAAFRRVRLPAAGLAVAGAVLCFPASLRAQQSCGVPGAPAAARTWSPPLDRIIPVRARGVAMRDGLDRVAAAANLRLSYSAEMLPLDRRVCVSADSISVGDALAQMLVGTSVDPVIVGADQIVLAPGRSSAPAVEPVTSSGVQTLERVVVTGSATGDAQRPLTVALDVLDGAKLTARSSSSFASTFDGALAGMWIWEQSPSSMLSRYASIRGASSFGLSYPKVYIDGIEVANPLLMTDLNPAVLDRIEVIRGPQGAALYGADAISGVVNIVTRHEGTQAGADRTELSSGAGFTQTDYASSSVFAQNHALSWRGGSSMRSGSVAVNATSLGGYVPQAYSRDLKVNGGLHLVTSKASITGTARFYGKEAAIGENPLLVGFLRSQSTQSGMRLSDRTSFAERQDSGGLVIARDSLPESVHEYTIGGTATLLTPGHWVPTFVAGIDGYRLANVPNDLALISSATDTALHAARGGADRGTFRASLVGQYDVDAHESLTLTLAAEQSLLREVEAGNVPLDQNGLPRTGAVPGPDVIAWRSNSGFVVQGNVAVDNAFFLTSGVRLERNDGYTAGNDVTLLPMFGASYVRDLSLASVKVRGAYGRGIRPVETPIREAAFRDAFRPASLEPEEQSGTEFGVDLLFGRGLGLHVTRFDQTATNLIQHVALPREALYPGTGPGSPGYSSGKPRIVYMLQNVGEISNRGWEIESSLAFGALSVGGGLSLVDSRVQRTARYYTGDLRPGDRMLAVPAATTNLSLSWTQSRWFASISAARASDWINYDRLKLLADFTSGNFTADSLTGPKLRANYWKSYDGVTRLRATISRDLIGGFALHLTGDNLTNVQRGEPDNITVLPGRTVLLGLSAKIR